MTQTPIRLMAAMIGLLAATYYLSFQPVFVYCILHYNAVEQPEPFLRVAKVYAPILWLERQVPPARSVSRGYSHLLLAFFGEDRKGRN